MSQRLIQEFDVVPLQLKNLEGNMRFMALGGAREVGASCYFIEIDGRHLLLDCGLRSDAGADKTILSLPDLERIDDVEAVFISHAHLDHVGSLPTVMRRFPKALCFMTVPTFPLAVTMLLDATRHVERDFISLYPLTRFSEGTIERLAERVLTVRFQQTFHPFKNSPLTVTFLRAGHILGAGGILIQGKEENIFYTGDFSLATERTVAGADFLVNKLDVLVTETTYGDRDHPEREQEEQKLADIISETVSNNGKILLPAFALSKAQELLMALQNGQAEGTIPPVPIFVDGLVRDICDYYEEMIKPGLFFGKEAAASIIRVVDPETRRYVLAGSSCIVVASSGQLVGGPSVSYALELLPRKENALIFTSYHDEESPSGMIRNMKPGDNIALAGMVVSVRARVEKLNFSTHADQSQLVAVARALKPKVIIGVHGELFAGECFKTALFQKIIGSRFYLPANGEEISPL